MYSLKKGAAQKHDIILCPNDVGQICTGAESHQWLVADIKPAFILFLLPQNSTINDIFLQKKETTKKNSCFDHDQPYLAICRKVICTSSDIEWGCQWKYHGKNMACKGILMAEVESCFLCNLQYKG